MDSILTIHVGRVFSIGNRWGIKLLDGTDGVVLGPDGLGMEKTVAERVLDAIERQNKRNNRNHGLRRGDVGRDGMAAIDQRELGATA